MKAKTIMAFSAISMMSLFSYPLAAEATVVTTDFTLGATPGTNTTHNDPFSFALGSSTVTVNAGSFNSTTLVVTPSGALIAVNNRGGDEVGLGVCNSNCSGSGGEINHGTELLQLSMHAAELAGLTNFTFEAGSATDGEEVQIFGSNSATSLGTSLATFDNADGDILIATAQNFQFLNVISANDLNSGDVLLRQIDATAPAVPEPASLAIFGTALAGLGLIRRRRKAAASA